MESKQAAAEETAARNLTSIMRACDCHPHALALMRLHQRALHRSRFHACR